MRLGCPESVYLTLGHDVLCGSRVRAEALPKRIPPHGAQTGSCRPLHHPDRSRPGYQRPDHLRKQELIDTGQLPGLNRAQQAEVAAANKLIRELETDVAIQKGARKLLREPHDPNALRGDNHRGRRKTACAGACRWLSVAVSGCCGWRSRDHRRRE